MAESNPQQETPGARSRASRWYVLGGIILGVGLLLAIVASAILHDDRAADSRIVASPGTTPLRMPDTVSGTTAPTTAPTTASTTTTTLTALQNARAEGGYLVVEATSDPLEIYDRVPPGSVPVHTLPQKGELDVTATFWAIDEAIDDQGYTWYQVYVPVRPNGTKGWVKASDVATKIVTHDVRIHLSGHRLDLYDRGQFVRSYDVGVGTDDTPTPPGEYFVSIKAKPPDPGTVYGVLVIGLSAFSEKLADWPGGGQVGIHGTNDPSTIGTDVSHGCIRLRNEDILELSNDVPLGTPVFVES
jgi:lipoprotein-anchoring transpeptidase ErfK/SrfK